MCLTKSAWPPITVATFLAPSKQLAWARKYDIKFKNRLSFIGLTRGFCLKINTVELFVKCGTAELIRKNPSFRLLFPFSTLCICHDNWEGLFQLVKIATWNTKVENLDLKYELSDFFQKFERSNFWVDYLPNCRIWD